MLELKKLLLKNVGVYKGTREIIFDSGLNIIQANNGKGKSTIIQMIEMLLANQYEGSFADYINDSSNEMFVALEFLYNTTFYKITLSCKRGKTTSTERILYGENDSVIASGEEVITILSKMFDPIITQYSLVAKQKPIDNIVTCKDADRRELFKKIKDINLEKYIKQYVDTVIEQLKNDIIVLEKEIYQLQHTEYNFSEKKNLSFTEVEIIEKRKTLQELITKQASIEQHKKEYDSIKSNINSCEQNISLIQNNIEKVSTRIQTYQNSINTLKSDTYKEEKLQSFKQEYEIICNKLITEITELQQKKQNLSTIYDKEILELNDSLNKIQVELDNIKIAKLIKFNDNNLQELRKQYNNIFKDIEYCNTNIKSFEKGVCPTCGNECTHKLQEWIEKKNNFENQLNIIVNDTLAEENKKKEYDKQYEDNEILKTKKQKLLSDKEVVEQKIATTEISYNDKIKSIDSLILEKEKQQEREKDKLSTNIESISESIQQAIQADEKRLQEVQADIISYTEDLNNKNSLLQELELKLNNLHIESVDFKHSISILENDIKQYESIIIENNIIEQNNEALKKQQIKNNLVLESKNKQLDELKLQLANNEQAKAILLKDFPNFIIDASIQEVEDGMNEFINTVYYKSLNISLRSTKTSIRLEYGLGENKLSASRLSGAESKIVSLAFINYFNQKINLKCIILDEPDSAMSVQIAESLYESLLSMNTLYNQLVIVTHNEKMRNYLMANTTANIISL